MRIPWNEPEYLQPVKHQKNLRVEIMRADMHSIRKTKQLMSARREQKPKFEETAQQFLRSFCLSFFNLFFSLLKILAQFLERKLFQQIIYITFISFGNYNRSSY